MGIRRSRLALSAPDFTAETSRNGHDFNGVAPLPRAPGALVSVELGDGLHLWAADLESFPDRAVKVRYGCPLYCCLCLEGDWTCEAGGALHRAALRSGDIGLYAIQPEQVWTNHPHSSGRLCTVGVEVQPQWLTHLANTNRSLADLVRRFMEGPSSILVGRASNTLRSRGLKAFHLDPKQSTRRLRLQSIALEILAEGLSLISDGSDELTHSQTPSLRERTGLAKARSVIDSRFCEPWTIASLASASGIGQKMLKYGFEAAFGMTVFGYLQSVRLQRAHEMLEGGMTVTATSFEVGYAHVGSFSRAFSQQFGLPPSQVHKSRTSAH